MDNCFFWNLWYTRKYLADDFIKYCISVVVVLICCYYKWHDKDDEGNSREVSRRRDRVFTENNGRDLDENNTLGYDHDRVGGIHLYR